MGTAYTEFDTTPASIVADIKAKILLSADWSNPVGNVLKCTTTDGAEMVVDLTASAATNLTLTMKAYRTHDGVTGTDSLDVWLPWHRTSATSAATDPVHVVVSAGKDHLFISTEGPRGGEVNADTAATGSFKGTFFLGAIVPYYDVALDPIPSVVCVGQKQATTATSVANGIVHVNRNAADTQSWAPAILETVANLSLWVDNALAYYQAKFEGLDGNLVLRPWVVREFGGGDRGRIKSCFYGGVQQPILNQGGDADFLTPGQKVSYAGADYMLHTAGRATVTNNYYAFGWCNKTYSGGTWYAPLLAVPHA